MGIAELERRVTALEQKLSTLAEEANSSASKNMNAWIDEIHGTFQDDAMYRKAAHLGRKWRKSQRRVPNLRVEDWTK